MILNNFKKRIKIFLTILITLIFSAHFINNNYLLFKAKDVSDNEILCTRWVKKGDCFVLRFRNSISRTFAEEVYTVLGENNILLNEFRYQSCDAGFPLGYEGDFYLENGFMVIKYTDKKFQKLDNIRIAITYPHYLLFSNHGEYNLTANAAGHILSITIEKILKL